MKHFKGFRVLSIPLGFESAVHHLYIKEHTERNAAGQKSNGRVLFVGNVEVCGARTSEAISELLTMLFESFGTIRSISLSAQGGGGGVDQHGADERGSAWYLGGDFDARISCQAAATSKVTRFAHVTFDSKAAVKCALSASDGAYADLCTKVAAKFGVAADGRGAVVTGNAAGCRRLSTSELLDQFLTYKQGAGAASLAATKEEVHGALRDFEERERQLLAAEQGEGGEDEEGAPDDDGFITVKRKAKKSLGGRRSRAFHAGSNKAVQHQQFVQHIAPGPGSSSSADNATGSKKRKSSELTNFYAFQKRESKAEVLLELRKQFEADREKIAAMKAQWKFKAL